MIPPYLHLVPDASDDDDDDTYVDPTDPTDATRAFCCDCGVSFPKDEMTEYTSLNPFDPGKEEPIYACEACDAVPVE